MYCSILGYMPEGISEMEVVKIFLLTVGEERTLPAFAKMEL